MATLYSSRRPRAAETGAAAAVLAVLLAVSMWLASTQGRFSPAVTVAESFAAARTVPDGVRGAVATPPASLLRTWPAELHPLGAAEAFTPVTLSDKIDGKAELYLPAGFVGLRCQRLAPAELPAGWLEAFVYDMGTPEHAFSVYSSQKRTAGHDAGIGDFSYQAANQLCFVHGRFYGEVIAAEEVATTARAAASFARAFVAETPVTVRATLARESELFPADGQIPNTSMLLSADVFGFDRLQNVFVARYRDGGGQLALYISRRASPAEATAMVAAVRKFFIDDCGGRELTGSGGIIDMGGSFEFVFASGIWLAGVHEAPSRGIAERWAAQWRKKISGSAP
jgi:hypothetical protein